MRITVTVSVKARERMVNGPVSEGTDILRHVSEALHRTMSQLGYECDTVAEPDNTVSLEITGG